MIRPACLIRKASSRAANKATSERRSIMERTITYTIGHTTAGQTIRGYLSGLGYSSQNLIQLKKQEDGILVNGISRYLNYSLLPGDLLTVHIRETVSSEKILPIELPFEIVYEDEDIMVINKPAGMPIHPSMNHHDNSLANGLAWYFAKQDKPFIFRCINRLDRDTSGLTVIAKHMVSAGILSSMVSRRELHRNYLAIVKGMVFPTDGTVNAPIARKEGSVLERIVDWEKGENAVTHYHVLESKNGYSLLSLNLETGRTHQIRVHMKYLGYPLIGDYLYYPDMSLITRQALHSHRLSFPHPMTGAPMEFTADLPKDMQTVLQRL